MAAIDVGPGASARASALGTATRVDQSNPANASGTLTSVEIWADAALSNCEVATFYVVSGNRLSTRATASIGAVSQESKQTFAVSLAVQTGDYLGIYYSAGSIDAAASGGVGIWSKAGDNIPCTNTDFGAASAGLVISIYASGATPATSPIFTGVSTITGSASITA